MRSEKKDMTGLKIGRLLVLKDSGERYNREVLWRCVCDCGNICNVRGGHLRSGFTQSCGCLQAENREKYNNLRHTYKTKSLRKSGLLKTSWDVNTMNIEFSDIEIPIPINPKELEQEYRKLYIRHKTILGEKEHLKDVLREDIKIIDKKQKDIEGHSEQWWAYEGMKAQARAILITELGG